MRCGTRETSRTASASDTTSERRLVSGQGFVPARCGSCADPAMQSRERRRSCHLSRSPNRLDPGSQSGASGAVPPHPQRPRCLFYPGAEMC
eukprot:2677578-Rhodomonas_salina.2